MRVIHDKDHAKFRFYVCIQTSRRFQWGLRDTTLESTLRDVLFTIDMVHGFSESPCEHQECIVFRGGHGSPHGE